MNERIKELAEQAGLKYHNWITNESNIDDGDFKYPRLEDYEKFAELIVLECAKAIADDDLAKDCDTFLMDSYAKGIRYSAEVIKEHFGVRE